MNILFYGDSHSIAFGNLKNCSSEWIGATRKTTMHAFANSDYNLSHLKNKFVVFSFGEIDSRYSIHNQILRNRNLIEIVQELVESYLNKLKEYSEKFNFYFGVLDIVPTSRYNQRDILGTLEQRREYVSALNTELEKQTLKNNISFLRIHKILSDDQGYFKQNLIDSSVHLRPELSYILNEELQKFRTNLNI